MADSSTLLLLIGENQSFFFLGFKFMTESGRVQLQSSSVVKNFPSLLTLLLLIVSSGNIYFISLLKHCSQLSLFVYFFSWSFFLFFVSHGCDRICGIVKRQEGDFFNRLLMRSWHYGLSYLGILYRRFLIFFFTFSIEISLPDSVQLNGLYPVHSSQVNTPIDQMSTFSSCLCPFYTISGAKQSSVPQQVVLFSSDSRKCDHPKSAIFILLLESTRIFYNLRSRCMMLFLWIQAIPWLISIMQVAATYSQNLLSGCDLSRLYNCPLEAYSRTKNIDTSSSKWLYSLMMLGWLSLYMIFTSVLACSSSLLLSRAAFLIYFMAYTLPVFLWTALCTVPNDPLPNFCSSLKSVMWDSHSHPASTVGEQNRIRFVSLSFFISSASLADLLQFMTNQLLSYRSYNILSIIQNYKTLQPKSLRVIKIQFHICQWIGWDHLDGISTRHCIQWGNNIICLSRMGKVWSF